MALVTSNSRGGVGSVGHLVLSWGSLRQGRKAGGCGRKDIWGDASRPPAGRVDLQGLGPVWVRVCLVQGPASCSSRKPICCASLYLSH